jgi:hypothetical protein
MVLVALEEGQAYYRLKMVDMDGSFAYSHIVSIFLKEYISSTVVYPNPAQRYITVSSSVDGTFVLYNAAGHQVWETAIKHGDNKMKFKN